MKRKREREGERVGFQFIVIPPSINYIIYNIINYVRIIYSFFKNLSIAVFLDALDSFSHRQLQNRGLMSLSFTVPNNPF